ncbi:transglycosylase SLT domain-containing protein [Thalassotalea agarivorans]|uniref:transglycosylase SLT domain-containing protein n=1 Tax=Thalassotalea agarivorans TaxID=349064 RepID=UPI001FE07E85|nr:transglycosylase SLT domain-containing protein [Thalassotalea agarivorans]
MRVVLLALLALSINGVAAQDKPIYKYKDKDGVVSFSDMQPIDRHFELIKVDCYACKVSTHVDWHKTKLIQDKYHSQILTASIRFEVDPALVKAIIHAESHFKKDAVSRVGAQGLMQLMPATAQELGVKNPFDAKDNINGGVKHLAKLLKKYNGNTRLASAAYNAGEGAVKKYGGIPPYKETKVYVERVQILHKRYKSAS